MSLACTAAFAQGTAQMSGSVRDPTGALLPGVEVTATQTATGIVRTAVTNETGLYILQNLTIGPYRLEAALPGFRPYAQTGIVLGVSSNPTVNIVLEIGEVTQSVEVQANVAMVETRASGVGQMMENQQILELPLQGRNVVDLVLLSGMATPAPTYSGNSIGRAYGGTEISVAGGLSGGTLYLLDGGVYNDPISNLALPLPFPDAVAEFNLQAGALSARYGSRGAATVNAVTKSGSNEFHGDGFWFFRRGALNARNTFALVRDPLQRDQFGGTIGGPIIRDKLFFFAGHQTTLLNTDPIPSFDYIPNAQMLSGDFTTYASPQCGRNLTLNASAGFNNNRIDPSAFSPVALNVLKLLPTTTDPCGEVRNLSPVEDKEFQTVGKVDYQVNEKHSMFGRLAISAKNSKHNGGEPVSLLALNRASINARVYSAVIGSTYLIGPNTVSNFRVSANRTVNPSILPPILNWADVGARVTLPSAEKFTTGNNFGGFQISSTFPRRFNSTAVYVSEDIGTVIGNHELVFGGRWAREDHNQNTSFNSFGTFSTNGSFSGDSVVDFLLGRASNYTQSNRLILAARKPYIEAYVDDTWKATSNLVINLGLRWDPQIAFNEAAGRVASFNMEEFLKGTRSTVYPNAPAGVFYDGDPQMPGGGRFNYTKWATFSPRIGLAWDVSGDGRTSVRTSYGIFRDSQPMFAWGGIPFAAPFGSTISTGVTRMDDPWANWPGGNPFPLVGDNAFPLQGSYISWPTELSPTYYNQWNLSVQRQISPDWLASVGYVGNSVIHLWGNIQLNPAIYGPGATLANVRQRQLLTALDPVSGPYYRSVQRVDDGGTGNYHGLLLSIQRRASNGLTVRSNYTFSHCIADLILGWAGDGNEYTGGIRSNDRGNCPQDRRHVFTFSSVYATPDTLGRFLGGWRVSGIWRMSSGSFFDVTSGLDTTLEGYNNSRVNQLLPDVFMPNRTAAQWLNRAAFARPADGTNGNLGVNSIEGPGRFQLDIALSRIFRVKESQNLEFRWEAFNLPNHVNLANPVNNFNNNAFGRIQSAEDPRIMQVAVKYVF
jgi:hypothetical protein